jgi:cell division protein FtsB
MECPVCKTISTTDRNICPVCNTDLEIFILLEGAEKRTGDIKRINYLLFSFLLLTLLGSATYYFFYSDRTAGEQELLNQTIMKQESEIRRLDDEKQLLMSSINDLRGQVEKLSTELAEREEKEEEEVVPEPPAFKEIIHVVKRGESLKRIARKYYGNSEEYHKIMKDNNIKNPNNIVINQRLKILVPQTN